MCIPKILAEKSRVARENTHRLNNSYRSRKFDTLHTMRRAKTRPPSTLLNANEHARFCIVGFKLIGDIHVGIKNQERRTV